MMNPNLTQSEKRKAESLSHQFDTKQFSKEIIFLLSSSDIGVSRNLGRNGSKFGPKALLNNFKKLSTHPPLTNFKFTSYEVANESQEITDFPKAQKLEAELISKIYSEHKKSPIIHIGGGHDHVYPLLKGVTQIEQFSEVIVINIDAHADTRNDTTCHSGTPFRQFANEYPGKFTLYQIGLNEFANSESTLSPLSKGEMNILWRKDLEDEKRFKHFFSSIKVKDKSLIIFSLDTDVLSGHEVPAVSAVNPNGISLEKLQKFYQEYLNLIKDQNPILGIYELNPVFDTLSGIGTKTISAFLFNCLKMM